MESIWDDDLEPISSPTKTKKPLFLADSDDDLDENSHLKQPPQVDIDIDAIFAGVDDDEDAIFNFKPLAPSLDTEALRREAEQRHRNRVPSFTPHAILPSSSPPRDTGHEGSGEPKEGGTTTGNGTKLERRKPVRLDEGRLLGPTGFPLLIKETKNFQTKGKGHEATDLNRLLQVYQFWTHQMYPKTQFRDTVERVEKLCHSKRMNVALSVWRDEAKGKETADHEDSGADEDALNELLKSTEASHSTPGSSAAEYASSSSRAPSRPPSSGTELDDDDDFDLDAVIRDEEERRAQERASSGKPLDGDDEIFDMRGGGTSVTSDDNGAAMQSAVDTLDRSEVHNSGTAASNTAVDEDQAMWDELDALHGSPDPISSVTNLKPPSEDEDMWDLVNEIENAPVIKPPLPTAPEPDDDDWEAMYL